MSSSPVSIEEAIKGLSALADTLFLAIYPQHPAVLARRPHRTIADLEAKAKMAEQREQKEKEEEEKRKGEIHATELWKPFETTVPFFVAAEKECVTIPTLPIDPFGR